MGAFNVSEELCTVANINTLVANFNAGRASDAVVAGNWKMTIKWAPGSGQIYFGIIVQPTRALEVSRGVTLLPDTIIAVGFSGFGYAPLGPGTQVTFLLNQGHAAVASALATSLQNAPVGVAALVRATPPLALCTQRICPDLATQVGLVLGYAVVFEAVIMFVVVGVGVVMGGWGTSRNPSPESAKAQDRL